MEDHVPNTFGITSSVMIAISLAQLTISETVAHFQCF